jgi:alcohol dehydrogenase (NADP+)
VVYVAVMFTPSPVGGVANLPLCVGHEIVGHAIKVGDKVTTVKVGDRVGVGAQIWACLECKNCKSDNENYCPHQVGRLFVIHRYSGSSLANNMLDTYNAPYPDGTIAQGGYASHVRAHGVLHLPDTQNIPSEIAAPMMCAGLTTWSPSFVPVPGQARRSPF